MKHMLLKSSKIGHFLVVAGLFFLFPSLNVKADVLKDVEYFKGRWTVKLRENSKTSFDWTLKEDLNGAWLAGSVENNGNRVSSDFWRIRNNKIERMAFTADRLFIKVESEGWKMDKLIFEGVRSDGAGETKIRETITKIDKNRFDALWEFQRVPDGKWLVLSDEICIREKP